MPPEPPEPKTFNADSATLYLDAFGVSALLREPLDPETLASGLSCGEPPEPPAINVDALLFELFFFSSISIERLVDYMSAG